MPTLCVGTVDSGIPLTESSVSSIWLPIEVEPDVTGCAELRGAPLMWLPGVMACPILDWWATTCNIVEHCLWDSLIVEPLACRKYYASGP